MSDPTDSYPETFKPGSVPELLFQSPPVIVIGHRADPLFNRTVRRHHRRACAYKCR